MTMEGAIRYDLHKVEIMILYRLSVYEWGEVKSTYPRKQALSRNNDIV